MKIEFLAEWVQITNLNEEYVLSRDVLYRSEVIQHAMDFSSYYPHRQNVALDFGLGVYMDVK